MRWRAPVGCVALAAAMMVVVLESAFGAALLDLGRVRREGEYIAIPVEFTPDAVAGTAGLQFDLRYDPAQFQVETVGAAYSAVQSAKGVTWSEPAPGQLRVLVAGMNQSLMPQGTVASVYLIPVSVSFDSEPCEFTAGIASGPFGEDVPLAVPMAQEEETASGDTSAKTGNDGAGALPEPASKPELAGREALSAEAVRDSSQSLESAADATPGPTGGHLDGAAEERDETVSGGVYRGGVGYGGEPLAPRQEGAVSPGNPGAGPPELRHSAVRRPRSAVPVPAQGAMPGTIAEPQRDATDGSGSEAASGHRVDVAMVPGSGDEFDRPNESAFRSVQNDSPRADAVPSGDTHPSCQAALCGALGAAMALVLLIRWRFLAPRAGVRRQ